MAAVKWEKGIFVAVKVNLGGGYQTLGAPIKLQAVPYALFAMATPRVLGTASGAEADEPIFEVKNSKGVQVFGVYEGGVRFNVQDGALNTRGPRGGFAIATSQENGGEGATTVNRFAIADGGVNFLVDEGDGTRGPRGGFAIATSQLSRGNESASQISRFSISGGGVNFLVDESDGTRGPRGGFAIATSQPTRGGAPLATINRFALTGPSLDIVVDPVTRGPRGGFAIAHRNLAAGVRGETPATVPLFNVDDQASYFTLRNDVSAKSTFSFRDRTDEAKVIVNFTSDGKMQAGSGKVDEVLKPAKNDPRMLSLQIKPRAELSPASRWLVPVLIYGQDLADYTIELNPDFKDKCKVRQIIAGGHPDEKALGIEYLGDSFVSGQNIENLGKVCLIDNPSLCSPIPSIALDNTTIATVSTSQTVVIDGVGGWVPLDYFDANQKLITDSRALLANVEFTVTSSIPEIKAEYYCGTSIKLTVDEEYARQLKESTGGTSVPTKEFTLTLEGKNLPGGRVEVPVKAEFH